MNSIRLVHNTLKSAAQVNPLDPSSRAFHESLPGYDVSPLRPAPSAARALGVRSVHVKDESNRLGTPSFKILGASWATFRVLLAHLGLDRSEVQTLDALKDALACQHETFSLAAATDGNHGRAVAIIGRMLGLSVKIFVPSDMVQARIEAIKSEGAVVSVIDGGYDDAIAASAAVADDNTLVVSDTSWEGYTEPPSWVIDGYSTMINEVLEALSQDEAPTPTVVAAQIGVGAFAAAVARGFANVDCAVVGVEPTRAECVTASIEAGEILTIPGPQTSIMAGLNCGTPSVIAWNDVSGGYDTFVTVTDDDARHAMRLLAVDGIVSGESGAAGLAGLLAHSAALELNENDTVLLFSTEGATDKAAYDEIIAEKVEA